MQRRAPGPQPCTGGRPGASPDHAAAIRRSPSASPGSPSSPRPQRPSGMALSCTGEGRSKPAARRPSSTGRDRSSDSKSAGSASSTSPVRVRGPLMSWAIRRLRTGPGVGSETGAATCSAGTAVSSVAKAAAAASNAAAIVTAPRNLAVLEEGRGA